MGLSVVSPERRMQTLLAESAEHGHDDDCRHCAMSRVLALLSQHADREFLGAVSMALKRLELFGSVRLPEGDS